MRFNARSNPVPSRASHNTLIEVAVDGRADPHSRRYRGAVVLAAVRRARSGARHRRLRSRDDPPLTIKATGNQWYWTYEYPDNGDISFNSMMLTEEERAADPDAGPRLLAVDNPLVVPVGKVVRMQVIGADVIHAFAVPSFGVKIDAVPGRLNETWFRVDREGIYYGQCSELCGRDHAFMPIAVQAVSPEKFAAWVAAAGDRSRRRQPAACRRPPSGVGGRRPPSE